MKANFNLLILLSFCQLFCLAGNINASHNLPDTSVVKTKIHGDENSIFPRKRIAIIGDGYTENEQFGFDDDVKNLILGGSETIGFLQTDVFKDYQDAFEIYSLFVASKESGVTTKSESKDTALGIIYTGEWENCYLEEYIPLSDYKGDPQFPPTQPPVPFTNQKNTNNRIEEIFKKIKSENPTDNNPFDYVIILANYANENSGCRRGNRVYVTKSVPGDLLAHEFGHAVANLFDEYWDENKTSFYQNQIPINEKNCGVKTNNIPWKQLLTSGISIPTIDEDPNIIGLYKGCNYHSDNIYRPSFTCKMKDSKVSFCKVCNSLLKKELEISRLFSLLEQPNNNVSEGKQMNLVVRLSKNGASEILQATQTFGKFEKKTDLLSNYIFELRKNGNSSSVGKINEDPFLIRAFSEKGDSRGEIVRRAETSIITVSVPNVGFDDLATNNLSIRFYQLEPKTLQLSESIEVSNQNTILDLKKANKLERFSDISTKELKSIKTISP